MVHTWFFLSKVLGSSLVYRKISLLQELVHHNVNAPSSNMIVFRQEYFSYTKKEDPTNSLMEGLNNILFLWGF